MLLAVLSLCGQSYVFSPAKNRNPRLCYRRDTLRFDKLFAPDGPKVTELEVESAL